MMRTLRRPQPRPRTLADDLRDDVTRMLERLRNDRDLIVIYWNQLRDRSMLLDALRTDWHGLTLEQLLTLDEAALDALEAFHAGADQLRTWSRWTEVMPATLEKRLDAALAALEPLGQRAVALLEPRP